MAILLLNLDTLLTLRTNFCVGFMIILPFIDMLENLAEIFEGCSEKLNLQSYLEMLGSETGCFGTIGKQYYIGYYPIRSYRKIKVYRV